MALSTPILAVCGVGPQVSRKALFDRFKGYGYIQGIDIGGWEADNRSAFIYYSNAVSVQRALQANVFAQLFPLLQLFMIFRTDWIGWAAG